MSTQRSRVLKGVFVDIDGDNPFRIVEAYFDPKWAPGQTERLIIYRLDRDVEDEIGYRYWLDNYRPARAWDPEFLRGLAEVMGFAIAILVAVLIFTI